MTTIAERTQALTRTRTPYVRATVVRAQEPTSAHAGDAAVILGDGTIEGFVGGVCAESSVRAAALDALSDGRTLLLRVLPDDAEAFPDTPGARVVVNPCLSGGAVEIFLQPMLPAPVVRLVGGTPIADAVATLAAFLNFEVDRASEQWGQATAVVVAGLGKGEEAAIRAALDAGVGYVALVASRTRGAGVLDEMGLTDTERARIHTPAGLDIGARTSQEIALSIMGEVVRAVRRDGLAAPATGSGAAGAPRESIDPVCGMTVYVGPDTPHATVDGQHYWFCRPGCRDTFLAQHEPSTHAGQEKYEGHEGHAGHETHAGHAGHETHAGHAGHEGYAGHEGQAGHEGHTGHEGHAGHGSMAEQAH